MTLYTIIIFGIILSVAFHFVGVYAGAKKTVWLMLVLVWVASINVAMSEVKPTAYKTIDTMKGHYKEVDVLIKESMPKISVYEMLSIKKCFDNAEQGKKH